MGILDVPSYSRAQVDAAVALASRPSRKRLVTFGTGAGTGWNTSSGNLLFRVPFQVPKKGVRFRVRFHNYNQSAGASGVGSTLTFTGLAVGPASLDGSSNPDGNFSAAPVQVVASTVMPADGAAWYSPWIDVSSVNVRAGDMALLSFGVIAPFTGGMQWARSTIPVFYRAGVAATDVATQTVTISGTSPVCGDFSVQWETIEGQPSTLFVGDSMNEGFGAGQRLSYPNRFGQLTGTAVATTAHSGGTVQLLAGYPSTAPLWEKVGLLTNTPDSAVVFLGSNDLNSGRTAAQIQADLTTIWSILGAAGVTRRFIATVPPRALAAGPEAVRQTLNTWIRANTLGAARVFDFDALLKDTTDPTILKAATASDSVHPNAAGYELMAAMVRDGGVAIL